MVEIQQTLHTPMGELSPIAEEAENEGELLPPQSSLPYQRQDLTITSGNEQPIPNWNNSQEYYSKEYSQQINNSEESCYSLTTEEGIAKSLDHTILPQTTPLPPEQIPPEVPTKILFRDNHDTDPITILRWHWTTMPLDKDYIPEDEVILKLTTKEKFTKFSEARKNRHEGTHKGTPEIGDARRYYENTTKRYVTALILQSKETPLSLDNLQLALWNLHCQMETLGAKRAHMQPGLRVFKPLDQMTVFLAIEKQFMDTDIQIHIWIPERHK